MRTPFHIEIPESSYNFNEKWEVKAYGNEKIIVRVVDPINIKLFCDTIGEPLKLIVVKGKASKIELIQKDISDGKVLKVITIKNVNER